MDARPNDVSIVKPGELVDIVEMSPLTLTDRRIHNKLIEHAWPMIAEPVQHRIAKHALQDTLHRGNERVDDSIRRLMSSIVEVRVREGTGWVTKRVQLLGSNVIPDANDGYVHYDFHPLMREIISESRVFARLQWPIMYALTSKYALALYEMIQKRGNMKRTYEDMSISDFRNFLGVPPGKLLSWINFKNFAIKPAVTEVSNLSDFTVTVEPIRRGVRGFTHIRLSWERKTALEVQQTNRELDFSKVGRKARLSREIETVVTDVSVGESHRTSFPLRPNTFDKVRKLFPQYEVHALESEWRSWARSKPAPDNPDAAFIAFCKTYARRHSPKR